MEFVVQVVVMDLRSHLDEERKEQKDVVVVVVVTVVAVVEKRVVARTRSVV